ncbi:hypothetical protein DSECCO2_429590 [anaerobic digester metagenome]
MVLGVILKFPVIPVILKGGGDLVDGFGQIPLCDLGVPLEAAGQRCVGEIGGTHIGGGEAGVAEKHIGLRVKPGLLGVVADLDLRIWQLPQFLDGLHVGGSHVGGCDDAQLAAVLGKLSQIIHDEPQTAPFDKAHQHVNAVGGGYFFFQLCVHLRLMDSTGEQAASRHRGLRAGEIRGGFAGGKPGVSLPQKRKKLLCLLRNGQSGKVSFLCGGLYQGDNLVGERHLRGNVAAVIQHVVQAFLNDVSKVLGEHPRGLCLVNGRSLLAGLRDVRQLAAQSRIDDLFV